MTPHDSAFIPAGHYDRLRPNLTWGLFLSWGGVRGLNPT